ncbi:MAG: repressor LexA [Candidatus Glassbacteria bacterium RIFCSPLOWO2_12_FULL_58_11]|uniref:LexA repressor n=2 Tax=Candidatus Glassiibacteriota TaxID=1817805 RepID=A0A1F5YLF4_9BACT|nr:MAG: repressor LexA [Candidatus Glassbacteria bacterium GWA2_58_10]OGG01011.1 MAG: repressor LexA [Candidatus Glassbacteria bacterium RIFCSPLOWO2_12_FULL_58_11]
MYLTRRQKEILDFIGEHIESFGYAPSIEEICARFGLNSTATVHKHLSNLEAKGLIRRLSNRSRAIELCRGGERGGSSAALSVPLLGKIAAGRPIEALEVPESIDLPGSLVGRRPTFVLKVEGDSMIDEQIRDGDYVIVEQAETAGEGQIVVALIGGEEATLKRFYREKGGVRLQPANVNLSPIILRDGEFRIQGVVIGVLRKY